MDKTLSNRNLLHALLVAAADWTLAYKDVYPGTDMAEWKDGDTPEAAELRRAIVAYDDLRDIALARMGGDNAC